MATGEDPAPSGKAEATRLKIVGTPAEVAGIDPDLLARLRPSTEELARVRARFPNYGPRRGVEANAHCSEVDN